MSDLAEARLTVDLDALAANYAFLKRASGGAETAPVVKANAYGLGLTAVARRLWAEGARSFFVARIAEGEALRAIVPHGVIYVLDGCPPGQTHRLRAASLTPVLNSLDQIDAWARDAPREAAAAALHVDTGMNRLGVTGDELAALAASRDRLARVEVTLLMSQLACAGEPGHPLNARQLGRFRRAATLFPDAKTSFANSAGVFLGRDYTFDLTRPGIALYGGGPCDRRDARLQPVVAFEAPILQLRTVRPGETVGYGATYTADRTQRVAVVGAGYADGVLRGSSGRGYGVFDGHRLPMLGRVSMDLIAMDATDIPGLRPGVPVQLIGPDVALDAAATAAGTLAYELLVRLGARGTPRYLGAAG